MGAQHLKEHTDHMIVDYEKLKEDLNYQLGKNADLTHNLNVNANGRRKAEDDLLRLTKDFDEFKSQAMNTKANDSREIGLMQSRLRELQSKVDSLEAENRRN